VNPGDCAACAVFADRGERSDPFPVRHYVTVTSSWYVVNALAQYLALARLEAKPVSYHALCMDELAWRILTGLNLPGLSAVSISDFETPELVSRKQGRSLAEYCWTAKARFVLSVLESTAPGDGVTYLDADIYPFADQTTVWRQLAGCDIILTPHRFTADLHRQEIAVGRYNAGMISLRHTGEARRALAWWGERSLEWCYYREENGRLGDQQYLTCFPDLFAGVEDCRDRGVNLGPWSEGLSHLAAQNGTILLDARTPLRSYHFHQYSFDRDGGFVPVTAAVYRLAPELIRLAYEPYTRAMLGALDLARNVLPDFSPPPWAAATAAG
jgi:hypothetical protein